MCPRIYLPMGSAVCLALLFSTSEIWAQGRPPAPGRGGAPVEQQGRGARSSDENTERQGGGRGEQGGGRGEQGGERGEQGERGSTGQEERGGRRERSARGDQADQQTGEENGRGRWSGRGDRGGDRGGEEGGREPSGRGRWSGRGERGDGGERGESGRGESGRGESGRGESRAGRGRGEGDEGDSRSGDREASRERGRSRRPVAGELREQVLNQLVALDLNQNGQIEPAEANSLSSTIMRQLGLDPGRPIYLDTLRSLVNQLDLTTVPFETDAGLQAEGERASFEFPSVPNRQRERGEDMGFAGTENPILSDPTPMEERYSPLVLEEVRSLLARYDANRNGVLDPAEIAAVPWATANPLESDLDQDGRLSDIELAERMKSIGGGEESTSGRSRRSRTRRTEGQAEDDPRAAARAAAEEERERRAEERKQRERERKNSGPTDRVATYVKDLIGKLDTDKDGSLTIEEASAMRNPPPKSADKDENGVLTYEELYGYYGDGQSPSGSSSSRSGGSSRSTASERGPLTGTIRWDGDLGPGAEDEEAEWPAELARKDQNNDGMISLAEFSTSLSAADREAFSAWDRNGDGYVTRSEAQQPGGSRAASTQSSSSRGERETSSGDRSRSSSARRGGTENASESPGSARRSFGRSRSSGPADAADSDRTRGGTGERTSDRSGDARRSGSAPRSTEANRDARGNASERGSEQAPPANALRYSIFGN